MILTENFVMSNFLKLTLQQFNVFFTIFSFALNTFGIARFFVVVVVVTAVTAICSFLYGVLNAAFLKTSKASNSICAIQQTIKNDCDAEKCLVFSEFP